MLSAILTTLSQEEHEWQYFQMKRDWKCQDSPPRALSQSQGHSGLARIFVAEYQSAARDRLLSCRDPWSDPAWQLPCILMMQLVSRNDQKKLPLHLSHCFLTCTELYFWGNGQPQPRGPLAILNYIKAENTVNQAGNFNATFGHNDHQSFIPISHNWNPAQVSAVSNEIPSLMTSFHQT